MLTYITRDPVREVEALLFYVCFFVCFGNVKVFELQGKSQT
jgi:hypothetical protein